MINGISQRLDGTEVSPLVAQQQQQQGGSPSIAGRPLPPATGMNPVGGGSASSNLPPQLSSLLLQQHLSSQQQQRQLPVQQSQNSNAPNSHPPPIPQTPAQQVLYSPADRFGLLGLLNIIKMSADPNSSLITLGTDLEKLGLDLGSSKYVVPVTSTNSSTNRLIMPSSFPATSHLASSHRGRIQNK